MQSIQALPFTPEVDVSLKLMMYSQSELLKKIVFLKIMRRKKNKNLESHLSQNCADNGVHTIVYVRKCKFNLA